MPEPHIFDSVTAPADCRQAGPSAAWRAGAWPWPAIRQLPISTSSTASPVMPARSTAALMATRAELVRGERREVAEQAADRRAGGGDDDDGIGHGKSPFEWIRQADGDAAVAARRVSKRLCAS